MSGVNSRADSFSVFCFEVLGLVIKLGLQNDKIVLVVMPRPNSKLYTDFGAIKFHSVIYCTMNSPVNCHLVCNQMEICVPLDFCHP